MFVSQSLKFTSPILLNLKITPTVWLTNYSPNKNIKHRFAQASHHYSRVSPRADVA